MRPYKNTDYVRTIWYKQPKQNIQNYAQKCLDVHGGSNTHNRHVVFYNCHNGLNQGWTLDQNGEVSSTPPLEDGRRF